MKSKINNSLNKIVDLLYSLKRNISDIKVNIKESSIYNSKTSKVFRLFYSFIYNKILKHKNMIIPIILLLVLSPLISIVFGMEFSKNPVNNVPTIIVNHDESETVNSLIQMIEDNDTFNVIMHSENDDDLKLSMENGTAMAGIIIPENFSDNLLNGKEAKILSFVDGSVTSPSSAAKGSISEILNTIKSGYLMKLAEGKLGMKPQNAQNLISPIGYTYRFIGNPAKNMSVFMVEGLVLNCLQIAVAIVGAFISEKKNYIKLVGKGIIVGLLGSLSACACMYIQIKYFNIPYRGTIVGGLLLIILCNLGWSFFGILLNYSKKGNRLEAASSCGIVSMTMLFSGYTFPVLAMPEFFSKITNFMPNTHYIIPIRDISLLGYTYNDVSKHIMWLGNFVLLMLGFVTFQFVLSKMPKKSKIKKADEENELNSHTQTTDSQDKKHEENGREEVIV